MKEVLQVARSNVGIVAGGVAGFYLGGMAIGLVETGVSKVAPASVARFSRLASALVITGAAFYFATKQKKPDMLVAFGAVTLGHAINAGIAAFTTQSS